MRPVDGEKYSATLYSLDRATDLGPNTPKRPGPVLVVATDVDALVLRALWGLLAFCMLVNLALFDVFRR